MNGFRDSVLVFCITEIKGPYLLLLCGGDTENFGRKSNNLNHWPEKKIFALSPVDSNILNKKRCEL